MALYVELTTRAHHTPDGTRPASTDAPDICVPFPSDGVYVTSLYWLVRDWYWYPAGHPKYVAGDVFPKNAGSFASWIIQDEIGLTTPAALLARISSSLDFLGPEYDPQRYNLTCATVHQGVATGAGGPYGASFNGTAGGSDEFYAYSPGNNFNYAAYPGLYDRNAFLYVMRAPRMRGTFDTASLVSAWNALGAGQPWTGA
jgi:hypothetical protein